MNDPRERPATAQDSPLRDMLLALPEQLPVAVMDEIWIFPTRRLGRLETRVLVIAAFDQADDARRRIFTVQQRVRRDDRGRPTTESELTEHGSAPADRVARVVDGVLTRVDDELAAGEPRTFRIGGDPERWNEVGRADASA